VIADQAADAKLDRLAADFNAIIASVAEELSQRRQAEAAAQALNAGLATKVAERTEELETANRDLEAANRDLEAANSDLEAFSYTVAHDLRAPLRAIEGFADILVSEHAAELSTAGVGHLVRVRDAATRMQDLIRDLLEFSRLSRSELQRRPVELRRLVERAVAALLAESPERDVQVTIGELPTCFGDEALLQHVIDNLLSNSWKFTSARVAACVEVGSEIVAGTPAYFVRDNGVGFNPTYAEKIFEVFQRAHSTEAFPGTGIGLASVKRIVLRHGGRVWADSEPGQGATFHFSIGAA
jgi:light-regulated signal transduction histidine kinase (bacteriophytochrome)